MQNRKDPFFLGTNANGEEYGETGPYFKILQYQYQI